MLYSRSCHFMNIYLQESHPSLSECVMIEIHILATILVAEKVAQIIVCGMSKS